MNTITDNYDFGKQIARDLYNKIGLAQDEIDLRMNQIDLLANCNPHASLSRKGGGVGTLLLDKQGRNAFLMPPMVAADDREAFALERAYDDAPQFGIPSSGVPLPLLTVWTTKQIVQRFKAMSVHLLTEPYQQGIWSTRQVKIPTRVDTGNVRLYDDFSMNGGTAPNYNWVTRDIEYFEETRSWGEMQIAQFSLAKIDIVTNTRDAMSMVIAQSQNDVGFNGWLGVPSGDKPTLYGILNEPNLNPAISLPADGFIPGTATPTTAWSGKDYNQILRDIRLLVTQVLLQALGNADQSKPWILAIPPSASAALQTPNPIGGALVSETLKTAYPNLTIAVVPNFESSLVVSGVETGQTVVMVLFLTPEGEKPYYELFTTKGLAHRPLVQSTAMSEKESWGIGGVVLHAPMFVSYAYGC